MNTHTQRENGLLLLQGFFNAAYQQTETVTYGNQKFFFGVTTKLIFVHLLWYKNMSCITEKISQF